MTLNLITADELTPLMEAFGNEASLKVQAELYAAFPGGWLSAAVGHSLGLRESGLRNIRGGAILVNGAWEPSDTDEGVFQITNTVSSNAEWLRSVPGCPNGSFDPDMEGWRLGTVNALTKGHNPTLSAGLTHTIAEFKSNLSRGSAAHVGGANLLRFCVAAHNAGFGGALDGYLHGNVDEYTTLGNYSAWVLAQAPIVAGWIAARPKWQWSPPKRRGFRRLAVFGSHGTHHT